MEWLWNLLDSFVICYCLLFWTWLCTTFSGIPIILNLLMNRNIVTGSDGQWCVYTNVVLFFLILFFSETSESSWVKWARENKRRVQEIKIKNYFFFPPPLPLALVVNKSPAVYNIINFITCAWWTLKRNKKQRIVHGQVASNINSVQHPCFQLQYLPAFIISLPY